MEDAVDWVPGKVVVRQGPDFRSLESSMRGYKVGPSSTANTTKTQPAARLDTLKQEDDEELPDAPLQTASCPVSTVETTTRNVVGVGKKSNRPWKAASQSRASSSIRKVSKSWEQKMKLKQDKKHNQACALEAKERAKEVRRLKHEQRRAAEEKKEENRKKNDAAHGVLLSAAAARRLMKSKKGHKELMTC